MKESQFTLKIWLSLLLIAVLFVLLLCWLNSGKQAAPQQWQALVCDLGQGSGTLLRTGEHRAILVDTGPENSDLGACLDWAGIHTLEGILLSHDHADHTGNLELALTYLEPAGQAQIFCPAQMGSDCGLSKEELGERSAQPLEQGQIITSTGIRIESLWPSDQDSYPGIDFENKNNTSLILLCTLKGDSEQEDLTVLLPGDAEQLALETALKQKAGGDKIRIDALVVPHHGSKTSGSSYLNLLSTPLALISAGKNNPYGHPHTQVVRQLQEHGIRVVSTLDQGHCALYRQEYSLHMLTQKQ